MGGKKRFLTVSNCESLSKGSVAKFLVICLLSTLFNGIGMGSSPASAVSGVFDIGATTPVTATVGRDAISAFPSLTFVDAGTNYQGKWIEYAIDTSGTADQISVEKVNTPLIATNAISVSGSTVYKGDGTKAVAIGTIDGTKDGIDGRNLRINFVNSFSNGDFSSSVSSTVGDVVSLSGWTGYKQRVYMNGVSTIGGWPAPADTTFPSDNDPTANNDSSDTTGQTFTIDPAQPSRSGTGFSVELSQGGRCINPNSFCIVRGPYLISNDPVTLAVNDEVSFYWRALGASDAYDVYGYLLNVQSGSTIKLLDATGATSNAQTNWAQVSETIGAGQAGDYKFVFISGTWDATGGNVQGASLLLDDVAVTVATTATINDVDIQALTRLIKYRATSTPPSLTRTMNITTETGSTGGQQTINIIVPTPQTITFGLPADMAVSSTVTVAPTATSNLTVVLTSSTTSVCTVSGFVITAVSVGNCTITASQDGDVTFAAAPNVPRTFAIKTGQTITFNKPANLVVGTNLTVAPTASSLLTVTLVSDTPSICSVNGFVITALLPGECRITASQAGDSTYAPAPNVTVVFTIENPANAVPGSYMAFIQNGADNTAFPQTTILGETRLLQRNVLVRAGYTFTGWNTKADGTGTAFADQAPFKFSESSMALYAQWKLIQTKPTVTWAAPASIQEGTALSATQLNALAGVAGKFTYSPAAPTVLPVGKHTLKVTFVPTDPKFETVELTVEIEVLAKAKLTWANPASIVEGTAISSTQLNATGSVPGTFTYAPATGTILAVGRQTLRVTFTPTDTRLSAVTAEVTIDVTAKPEIIAAPPVSPTYSVTGAPKTSIIWGAGENAVSYTVLVDGKSACAVAALTCDVARLLGPKNVVTVTSVATSGKTSVAVPATYAAPASPQVLTVVNFDSARAVVKRTEAAKLRTFAAAVRAAGYTTLTVYGHTDSVGGVDNRKLSVSRANSTITFLKRALPGVKFTVSGFAASTPVGNNSTAEGKAANRRAEVFIP